MRRAEVGSEVGSRTPRVGEQNSEQAMKSTIAFGLMMISGLALGQPQGAPPQGAPPTAGPTEPPPPPPAREAKVMKWSEPELQKVGEALAGSWKTTTPVGQVGGESGATTDVVLSIAPVMLTDLSDTLYVEAARADSLWAPYRHAIFQLVKYKGGVRLRTLEFHKGFDGKKPNEVGVLTGMWLTSEWFPDFGRANLISTMDLDLKPQGDGWVGKTVAPFPASDRGAIEMTSELTIGKDTLRTLDTWFDAEGKVIEKTGTAFNFSRFTPDVTVERQDSGLIIIDFKKGTDGKAAEKGDNVAAHYTGWLAASGRQFDTSRTRGAPLQFSVGTIIEGWNTGILGAKKGTIRRLVIPPAMAYAQAQRGPIPPNSQLVFDIEVMSVEAPPPPPPPPASPEGGSAGTAPATSAEPPAPKAEPVEQPK